MAKQKKVETKEEGCPGCECASCEACECCDCECPNCAQEMMCGDNCGCGPCRCLHHYVRPALITVFGLVFLLNAFGVMSATVLGYTWPSLVTAYGLMKMFENKCGCCC